MSSRRLVTTWRETTGVLDAVTELHEPGSQVTWVDRYGRMKKGRKYTFTVNSKCPGAVHDSVILSEAEIGVQSHHYDSLTNKFNQISYLPAYKFSRAAGGLALASVIISQDGQLTVPLVQDSRKMLQPQDVIDDIHCIMYKDEVDG